MEKNFSKIEKAALKKIAKNAQAYVLKMQDIDSKIGNISAEEEAKIDEQIAKLYSKLGEKVEKRTAKLQQEKAQCEPILNGFQASFSNMTGGYKIEDLIVYQEEDTGRTKENGEKIMTIRPDFKYPETVVPPTPEIADAEAPITIQMPSAGNDFDVDMENSAHDDVPEEALIADAEAQSEIPVDPFNEDTW